MFTAMRHWVTRAQCNGMDPDQFDLVMNGNSTPPMARILKEAERGRLCDGCPVAAQCAAEVLEHGDRGIIRAGVPLISDPTSSWRAVDQAVLSAVAEGAPVESARCRWVEQHRGGSSDGGHHDGG